MGYAGSVAVLSPHQTQETPTMDTKPSMTRAQAEQLKAQGYAVHIYPRKKIVCVNGFKYYRLQG
jgi:hypothetical protein